MAGFSSVFRAGIALRAFFKKSTEKRKSEIQLFGKKFGIFSDGSPQ